MGNPSLAATGNITPDEQQLLGLRETETGFGIAPAQPLVAALAGTGVIRVGGADRTSFLQAQLTTNMNNPREGMAQVTCYCSPQGRAFGVYYLLSWEESWLLLTPVELLSTTLAKLGKYILRAKVALTDVSNDLALFGVVGDGQEQLLEAVARASPPTGAWRLPGAPKRHLLLCHPTGLAALPAPFQAPGLSPAGWQLLEISAGVAQVRSATSEQFLPQMLDLDQVGGLSFDKGCYPGQEIIARTRYRGSVKRTMRLAVSTAPVNHLASHPPGGDILSAAQQKSVGKVLASLRLGDHRLLVQAVMGDQDYPPGDCFLPGNPATALADTPLRVLPGHLAE